MGRPTELKTRVARNVIFENDELKEFEELVGKDQVSKEIRALIHNFLLEQKKGYARTDPLNLERHKPVDLTTNNNSTLDIYLLPQTEINKRLSTIDDLETLRQIRTKAGIIVDITKTSILNKIKSEKRILR